MTVPLMQLPALQFPQNAMLNFNPMVQAFNEMRANQFRERQMGIAERADTRAGEMHPLSMEQLQAQIAAARGGEQRAGERHTTLLPAELAQMQAAAAAQRAAAASAQGANTRANQLQPYAVLEAYNRADRPDELNDVFARAFGIDVPRRPVPQPPWPSFAGPPPPGRAGVPGPAPQAPLPPSAGQYFGPQSGVPVPAPQAPAQGAALQAPAQGAALPQPAAQPMQAAGPADPVTGPTPQQQLDAANYMLARGALTPQAHAALVTRITAPQWQGIPDAIRTQAVTQSQAAAAAAQGHQSTLGNIERMIQIAPQAFVGAGAETRTQVAALLQSFGVSPQWLIANQSLPATQLLQQGLSNFIGAEAEKYRPISNSDLTFIARTIPNVGQDRVALMNALEAARLTVQRQALYDTARAQLLMRDPNAAAQLPALLQRINQAIPPHQYDPNILTRVRAAGGQPGAAAPAAPGQANGTAEDGQVQFTAPPSRGGGTDTWRQRSAEGQQNAIRYLLQNDTPENRALFAQHYGRDVLATVMRSRPRNENSMSGQ